VLPPELAQADSVAPLLVRGAVRLPLWQELLARPICSLLSAVLQL
jgi:hypothetical protein